MTTNLVMTARQQEIVDYLKSLRENIITAFSQLEGDAAFKRTPWSYEKGRGGGEMAVLRARIFEKAAVNWSGIGGDHFPMADGAGAFFATGVSLITHMANPHAPTVHFNIRYIETAEKSWFGGGFDLTPMGPRYDEDTAHFHNVAERALDAVRPGAYAEFSRNAAEYFYIPHRKKERGVGGIFFDHLMSGDHARDYALWRCVGDCFLETIMPIYKKRIGQDFTEADRQQQLQYRAHYVEFNLLYDRGTKFGFLSGGNPEAILCSMPPLAAW